ncbi:MAG: heme exporter protein CcmD [Hyphomicrobiales bacterium]|nr:heme exporter protein CcmD [Rhodoblastus sp.]MCC0002985.1 heme exporter protein CcmD [Methylobacteriaceae bacterium]MCC2103338.1 heme exporter protein CcmD [Hyphomicrobiales bacterium]MCC2109031.1 heme exporter protein CcmD [Hyphomicrobiales bacterium]MCO5088266.1 heme exporter protein CcmD [Methylobacteriaceae bacterium]
MSHDHAFFIALSYGVTAIAVIGTIAAIMLEHRRLKKALAAMGVTVAARDDGQHLD